MFRRDYVMRLIERFGLALRQLRNRILGRQADQQDVRQEIEEIARQAGLDLDIARQLDPGMLLMWLAPTGDVDPPRLWLMGELLYLVGLHGREAGDPAWRADLERAAALFGRLEPGWRPGDDQVSAGERTAEIDGLLRHPAV